jgi:hypothetical protein
MLGRAVVQLARPPQVTDAEVVQANRNLNQTLIEIPRGTVRVVPQFLPHFVSVKERATIETVDASQVSRIKRLDHQLNDHIIQARDCAATDG